MLQLNQSGLRLRALRDRYQLSKLLLPSTFSTVRTPKNPFSLKYEKKTPIEHVLLRPGMYVGQVDWISQPHWIYNPSTHKMMKKDVFYSPALLKIVDEILVNAADNIHRNNNLTEIKITTNLEETLKDPKQNPFTITIENDGDSIPIEIHEKEKVYIPELIFGHLLTGSNFDDNMERFTGGSHGYGAKLTNIFSNVFQITIYDHQRKLLYEQLWEKNMSICHPSKVKKVTESLKSVYNKSFIKVSFQPDLTKFTLSLPPPNTTSTKNDSNTSDPNTTSALEERKKFDSYLKDITSLIHRRSLDIAGCLSNVTVYYNQKPLPVQSFQEYVKLFTPSKEQLDQLTAATNNKSASSVDGDESSESSSSSEIIQQLKKFSYDVPVFKINDRLEFSILPSSVVKMASSSSSSSSADPLTMISPSSSLSSAESISFVNNVWTTRGGQHVQYIQSQVIAYLQDYLSTNHKKTMALLNKSSISLSNLIKNQLFLFIHCKIENPSFDGQTKDALLTKSIQFQSSIPLEKKKLDQYWLYPTDPSSSSSSKRRKSSALVAPLENDNNATNVNEKLPNFYHDYIIQTIIKEVDFQEHYRLFQSMDKTIASTSSNKNRLLIQVPKLDDAHYAGHKLHASKCTLILTEGDSAKALAVAGLSELGNGRDYYGILPLRGKLLNVRGITSNKMVMKNQELMNICKSLNLQFEKKYITDKEFQQLRYGHLLLMTDQDNDGSHIKGLLINFIHYYWPALLLRKDFLQEFITPIVKIRPLTSSASIDTSTSTNATSSVEGVGEDSGKKTKKRAAKKGKSVSGNSIRESNVLSFYNLAEYDAWKTRYLQTSKDYKSYFIKYYKGLGTNTNEEGKEYFAHLKEHQKSFTSDGNESNYIDLVFNKDRALDRKEWLLNQYSPDLYVDFSLNQPVNLLPASNTPSNPLRLSDEKNEIIPLPSSQYSSELTYSDFINKEFIHFSFGDNVRSLPNLVDGLKPSQRKVLYGSFLKFQSPSRNSSKEMKVMQLSGFVAEKTSYHHGEQSLHQTIVNMAQHFVGGNNIPLLLSIGQFGTRSKGGDDYASPRYIYTKLSPLTRYLFPVEDDILLKYQEDDGISIEPEYYIPILPTLLLNGSKGIGTGWSTDIPSYNILDIIDYLEDKIDQDRNPTNKQLVPRKPLLPFYYGFKGKIYPDPSSLSISTSNGEAASVSSYITEGKLNIIDPQTIEIVELPLQRWTEDYKEFLIKLVEKGEITSFHEHHSIHSVRFKIKLSTKLQQKHITRQDVNALKEILQRQKVNTKKKSKKITKNEEDNNNDEGNDDDLELMRYRNDENINNWINYFKLFNRISLTNMFVFDENHQIKQFQSPEDIINHFYPLRLQYYSYRQQFLFQSIYQQHLLLKNQQTFLQVILQSKDQEKKKGNELNILQRLSSAENKEEMIALLKSLGISSEDEVQEQVKKEIMKQYQGDQLHPRLFNSKPYAPTPDAIEDIVDDDNSSNAKSEETTSSLSIQSSKPIKQRVGTNTGYDYLLQMPIYSFTKDRYDHLSKRVQETEKKMELIQSFSPHDLWKQDLHACRQKYLEIEKHWKFD
eukprot:gene2174-2315_t